MRNRADKKLQIDRQTDRPTNRQADSYILPKQSFGRYKKQVLSLVSLIVLLTITKLPFACTAIKKKTLLSTE